MAWLGTWAKRKAIKYGTTKPGSSLTDFPLLIQITADANLGTALGSTPKLAFTLADGSTAVNHGRISWSYSGGNVTASIRGKFSPTSSAATGDVLGYLYYDSTQTDTQSKSGVLDSNTVLYAPLEEDPSGSAPQMLDWSSGANDGTSGGSMASGASGAGKVGNGLTFDGSNDYISFANQSNFTFSNQTFTVSLLFKHTTASTLCLFSKGAASLGPGWGLLCNSLATGNVRFFGKNSSGSTTGSDRLSSSTSLNDGNWHLLHAVATTDTVTAGNNTCDLYIDGALNNGGSGSAGALYVASTADNFGLASRTVTSAPGTNPYPGSLDEVFVASVGRSADWIAYDYQNQFNNSNTVTLGTEESMPASGVIGPVLQGRVISPGRIFGGSLLQ